MFSPAIIPIAAVLNRFRGGGFGAAKFPGHPRFYVAPVLGLVCWLLGAGVSDSIVVAICYLAWSFVPWGHCIGLGRWMPGRKPAWLEHRALDAAQNNPWIALWFLETVGMSVAAGAMHWSAFLLPPLMVAAYEIGWRVSRAPIRWAEIAIGLLWGSFIMVALSGCASPKEDWGALAGGVRAVQKNGK